MYIPEAFYVDDPVIIEDLIDNNPFATLISCDPDQVYISHLPINRDSNGRLFGHLARQNPHAVLPDKTQVTAIFHGPHAYITPNAYTSEFNVPTWNYAVVHCHGTINYLDDSQNWDYLQQITRLYEGSDGWQLPPDERYMKMTQLIRFFTIDCVQYETKIKFNQNKSKEDRQAVIEYLNLQDPSAATFMQQLFE